MRGVAGCLVAERLSEAVLVDDVERFRNRHPEGSVIVMSREDGARKHEVVASYPRCCALRDMETGRVFEMQWKEVFMRAREYGRE